MTLRSTLTLLAVSFAAALPPYATPANAEEAAAPAEPPTLETVATAADLVALVQVRDTDYRTQRDIPVSGSAFLRILIAYKADRDEVRALHDAAGIPFVEVFVDCALDEAERRDPKGLYAKARAGEIRNFDASEFIPAKDARKMDAFMHYGIAACKQAIADSGIEVTDRNTAPRVSEISVIVPTVERGLRVFTRCSSATAGGIP